MKKLHQIKDKAIEANFNEMAFNLRLTDLKVQGEEDYWYDYPEATDKEPPFIRPCKSGSTRRLYFFDSVSEDWHYIQMSAA